MVASASDFQDAQSAILVIPIPITQQRRRERGYNQCELLVNEMKRLYSQYETKNTFSDTHAVQFIFENDLLVRTHHDSRHTLKGRADRVESVKGIFGVNEKTLRKLEENMLRPEAISVVIIDDVITTGSTMREAIDTMTKSGFTNVSGLSVAH